MRNFLLALALITLPFSLLAQNEGNVWYFGANAGADFNGGAPVALANGVLNTVEGCASISDNAGNLLFYTDGVTVYNQNHVTMSNGTGLNGGSSSTQSAIILKKPGSSTIYFIFTVDEGGSTTGMQYSEVDMTIAGGLGGITVKNVPVVPSTCEKLTMVRHANNTDWWVIVHLLNSIDYHSYLFTSAGLNMTPVVSSVGTYFPTSNHLGCIKATHDGAKLANAMRGGLNIVDLLDFNNATGQLSNPITLTGMSGPYGVEFSPNNDYLYIAESAGSTLSNVYQFDITSGNGAVINSSKVTIGVHNGWGGSLQIGPDGKIYHARLYDTALGVINNPDNAGLASNYVANGFPLAGGTSSQAGLPQIKFNPLPIPVITAVNFCLGDSTTFTSTASAYDSLRWNFDDVVSGAFNTAITPNTFHVFTDTGTYAVTLTLYIGGLSVTGNTTVNIIQAPAFSLGSDTTICQGTSLTLNAFYPGATYLWQNNATTSSISVSQSGTYWVTAGNVCGSATDSITVATLAAPVVLLGNDTTICSGNSLTLTATQNGLPALWSTGVISPSITVTAGGTYWAQSSNICGTSRDSITVQVIITPSVNLGNDTTLCTGTTIQLNAGNPGATYSWSNGSTAASISVNQPGTYWASALNLCGASSDTIQIAGQSIPVIALGNDTALCQGTTLTLDISGTGDTYLWSNNSTNPVFTVSQPGVYWAASTNICGTDTDSITISYIQQPAVNLGNDTIICSGTSFTLDVTSAGLSYVWHDNSAGPVYTVTGAGTYYVTGSNICGSASDTILVETIDPPTVNLGSDTTICVDEIYTLTATGTDIYTYLWSDNSTGPSIDVSTAGTYYVTAANICGSATDTAEVMFEECLILIEMPSVFSPNNDGLNEDFIPITYEGIERADMVILNRWGNVLFEGSDVQSGWDGSSNGTICPAGTYYWIVRYTGKDGSSGNLKGALMLIR